MDYHEHKDYFEQAYKNGSDIWTHLPKESRGLKLKQQLPAGSLVLDIGSGRGLFAKNLAEIGFKVIGVDFAPTIVQKANEEIAAWGLEGKVKFMEANALELPFTDASFDGACDFGLFENLYKEDWPTYISELMRVLKPGAFYLNVSPSKKTEKFFDFSPMASADGDFEKYGVHYHFFEKDEIKNIFEGKMEVISQTIDLVHGAQEIQLLETLFRKL